MKKIALYLFLTFASCSQAASFDCTKVLSPAEKAICADALLRKLDVVLAENYQYMMASNIGSSARKDLRVTQRKWLKERNQCSSNSCIETAYRKRIDAVCEYPVISGVHAICTSAETIK